MRDTTYNIEIFEKDKLLDYYYGCEIFEIARNYQTWDRYLVIIDGNNRKDILLKGTEKIIIEVVL